MFETYIMYSASRDQYYTGHTSVGAAKRVTRHNDEWTRSTKAGIPWELVYKKNFATKSEAIKWELFIKRQKSRSFIERLISSAENEV
ncbi:GIY-YIG nuclease family protein [Fodinibius sp.]|uniref:GIY-YIG nuclease family protein n=1 Tax=Fodinibius sp. TaxID=1872440 RepID=UPI003567F540